MKKAIVTGASGLVGEALMKQLVAHPDFTEIISIVRKPSQVIPEKVQEVVIDFDGLPGNLASLDADCAFCCLGTTLKTAGSKERQYEIDHDYVVNFAKACKEMNASVFAVVSSIGAAAGSGNFYLRTKGEMERDCAVLNFPKTVILRPSFLLGNRKEFRRSEKIAIVFMKVFSWLLVGRLRKYRGIEVRLVARRMISEALSSRNSGLTIFESDQIG